MEGNLHVEIAHPTEGGDEAGEAAPPLRPGGQVVVLHKGEDDLRTSAEDGFLERVPPCGVLKGYIGSGSGECLSGGGVAEADGEV